MEMTYPFPNAFLKELMMMYISSCLRFDAEAKMSSSSLPPSRHMCVKL